MREEVAPDIRSRLQKRSPEMSLQRALSCMRLQQHCITHVSICRGPARSEGTTPEEPAGLWRDCSESRVLQAGVSGKLTNGRHMTRETYPAGLDCLVEAGTAGRAALAERPEVGTLAARGLGVACQA